MAASLLALLLLLLPVACDDDGAPATPTAAPTIAATPSPAATPTPARDVSLPRRNLVELARRLRGVTGDIPTQVNAVPPAYQVGDTHTFSLLHMAPPGQAGEVPPTLLEIQATIRLVTPHAYFYFEDGLDVAKEDIEQAGRVFEETIYPTVVSHFGQERSPGIDNDPHITILHAALEGAGGYFSDLDCFPRAVSPISNEREMVYLDLPSLRPGGLLYAGVLAHELQHLVLWSNDPSEELWVNEGLSEVAAGLVREGSSMGWAFLDEPDTQLNTWDPRGENAVHYGAADLFLRYVAQRVGGAEKLTGLVAEPRDGFDGVTAFLAAQGLAADSFDLFADWLVANLLDLSNDPVLGHAGVEAGVEPEISLEGTASGAETVSQFGADYIEIDVNAAAATFAFDGEETVPLLPNQPHSGRGQWWSARGDGIDTKLTREIDLSGVSSATLEFWTWFDIERWYDYGYVEASADGGQTWEVLEGTHTTLDDPLQQAYGPGYTGRSGGGETAQWVKESMDLSRFAGGKLLLRFEYVTDLGVNAPGWAIDDLTVPEIGLADGAEADGAWQAEGFQRVTGPLQQRFLVQVIERGQPPEMTHVALDARNRASITLASDGGDTEAVIVIAGLTEGTTEKARYEYTLSLSP
ncbi:MAG: immune inhibitor A [Dehalococcoidia bacterium]|nr:immune inhibitor A [Dehalococcoidia bacterium]